MIPLLSGGVLHQGDKRRVRNTRLNRGGISKLFTICCCPIYSQYLEIGLFTGWITLPLAGDFQ